MIEGSDATPVRAKYETRDIVQLASAYAAAILLCVALLTRYYDRQPPFFAWPRTVVDHVGPTAHETRETILTAPEAGKLIPPGADVAVFRPRNGESWWDYANFLAAVGLLPHQRVLPPYTASPSSSGASAVEWVIAVGEPFQHPGYQPVAGFPHGTLYRRR